MKTQLQQSKRFQALLRRSSLLWFMLPSLPAVAQPTFVVKWNTNSELDLAGYRVFWGKTSGQYPAIRDVGKQTTTTLSTLTPGTRYYVALQAYNTSGLASQLSQEVSFTTPPPDAEIEVRTIDGDVLAGGSGVVSFGAASIGSSDAKRTWIIHNRGTGDLTGLAAALLGPNAAEFTIEAPVSGTLKPGNSANLTVSFRPSVAGTRSAQVSITSNDADNSPFHIGLSGTGGSPSGIYGTWSASLGLTGADGTPKAMPFHDGVSNLLKYAFNMNGAGPDRRVAVGSTAGLPDHRIEGPPGSRAFVVEYLHRKGSGLVYQPKVSSDLTNYSPMTGSTTVIPVDDEWDRVTVRMPVPAGGKLFGRVDVTLP